MNETNIIPFEDPITIKCEVKGKKTMAEIVAKVDLPLENSFVLRFSDGTTFETYQTDSGYWSAPESFKPYIFAVKDELTSFVFVMATEWYKFEINDQLYWVGENESNEFSVYTKGDYSFHLRKAKAGWEYHSVRVGAGPVDPVVAGKVAKELESRL